MIIIHHVNGYQMRPRLLTAEVQRLFRSFPVVLLSGARQTGKSTLLTRLLSLRGPRFETLDDLATLERAKREPDALLEHDGPLVIDEVQRAPELLLAIKRHVDRRARPGRFLLSGSANLALMQRVSESLAGRAATVALQPMTLRERAGEGSAGAWQALLDRPQAMGRAARAPVDEWALSTGFPAPALRRGVRFKWDWLEAYTRTYLKRDLQELARIDALVDFRRLMRAVALRQGKMMNQTELGRDVGLPQPTVHRYLNLLEASWLLFRQPAYAVTRTKRLIKTPRLFLTDAGLAASLAGVLSARQLAEEGLRGAFLETVVLADLLAWQQVSHPRPELYYWRTSDNVEVDFVLEHAGELFALEVKATSSPGLNDASGLRAFLEEYDGRARHGVVLHCGEETMKLADRIWAVPLGAVLRG